MRVRCGGVILCGSLLGLTFRRQEYAGLCLRRTYRSKDDARSGRVV
jgi:hypothetical protein